MPISERVATPDTLLANATKKQAAPAAQKKTVALNGVAKKAAKKSLPQHPSPPADAFPDIGLLALRNAKDSKEIQDFLTLLHFLHGILGIASSLEKNQVYRQAHSSMLKIYTHLRSAYILYTTQHIPFSVPSRNGTEERENLLLCDMYSVTTLSRQALETYLDFAFLYVIPPDEEYLFTRVILYTLSEHTTRKKTIDLLDNQRFKTEAEKETAQIQKFQETVQMLPQYALWRRKTQKEWLRGKWKHAMNWHEIADMAGLNRNILQKTSFVYPLLNEERLFTNAALSPDAIDTISAEFSAALRLLIEESWCTILSFAIRDYIDLLPIGLYERFTEHEYYALTEPWYAKSSVEPTTPEWLEYQMKKREELLKEKQHEGEENDEGEDEE